MKFIVAAALVGLTAVNACITLDSNGHAPCGTGTNIAFYPACQVQRDANNQPFFYYCDSNNVLQNQIAYPAECGSAMAACAPAASAPAGQPAAYYPFCMNHATLLRAALPPLSLT
jgi:hypothetical protein